MIPLRPKISSSTIFLIILIVLLNNLAGCEKECPWPSANVSATVQQLNSTSAVIHIQGSFGSHPLNSTANVSCTDECRFSPCLLSSLNVSISPFTTSNSIITFPEGNQINESTIFSTLQPGTEYTVRFSTSSLCIVPLIEVTFTTPEESCDLLCAEHGSLESSNCTCTCDEGWTGPLCNEPISPEDPPANLLYDPSTLVITDFGQFSSVTPTVEGTSPFTFSIVSIDPPNTAIGIVDSTGVIRTTGLLEFGANTYSIDVAVSNLVSSSTFPNAYTVVVE